MDLYRLPDNPKAIIFDLDNTLYTCDAYNRYQLESPVRRLAERRGVSFEEMNAEIRRYRIAWAEEHGGEAISLGNVFAGFGISMKETIVWREELYHPGDFLSPDAELRAALSALAGKFALGIYTNNPVSVAEKTLDALGIADFFPVITGLDTFALSKPAEKALRHAAEMLGAAPAECVSVGDRYDIDLALPLALGMGGVLVAGVRDVYRLPAILGARP